MAIFMVLVPPGKTHTALRERDLERSVFIKDGFSFPAFFLSIPWLLWQRLWLVLGVFLVATIALELGARYSNGPGVGIVSLLVTFLFALEANGLRRWTLERRGWRFVAVVEAQGRADAEWRFFTGLAQDTADVPAHADATVAADASNTSDTSVGAGESTAETANPTPGPARRTPAPRTSREQVVGLTLGTHRH
uniref:DUF2628 domain-containing protein n=1 Tax=Stappia sp. TaxID=1870903 RepID=UPI003BACE96B